MKFLIILLTTTTTIVLSVGRIVEVTQSSPDCLVNNILTGSVAGRYVFVCNTYGRVGLGISSFNMITGVDTVINQIPSYSNNYVSDASLDSSLINNFMMPSRSDILGNTWTRQGYTTFNVPTGTPGNGPSSSSSTPRIQPLVRCYHNANYCFTPVSYGEDYFVDRYETFPSNYAYAKYSCVNRYIDLITVKQDTVYIFLGHSTDKILIVMDHTILYPNQAIVYAIRKGNAMTGMGASVSTPVVFIGEVNQIVEISSVTYADLNTYPIT